MSWSPFGPFTDYAATPGVSAAFLNALESFLSTLGVTVATEAQLPASGAYYGQLASVTSASIAGSSMPVVERWNGTAWKRWDSDWTGFSSTTAGLPAGTFAMAYRYVGGDIEFKGTYTAGGTNSSGALMTFTLPVNVENAGVIRTTLMRITRPNVSTTYGSMNTQGSSVNTVYFEAGRADGTYTTSTPTAANGTPLTMASGDIIQFAGAYTPA